MDRGGKLILILIVVPILSIVGFKYKQFFLDKDFLYTTYVSCDPATESCFKVICEGESATSSGECDSSSGVIFSDGSPYKKIELSASKAPNCLLDEMTCPTFTCPKDDPTCTTTYCSDDTLEEGEECVPTTPAS